MLVLPRVSGDVLSMEYDRAPGLLCTFRTLPGIRSQLGRVSVARHVQLET